MAGADALDVRGLKVSASAKGEVGAMELQLTAPRLEASPARAAGERIELAFARRGAKPLEAKVLIDGVRGTASRLEATTVKITGHARSAAALDPVRRDDGAGRQRERQDAALRARQAANW